MVNVGIGGGLQSYVHQRVQHEELHLEHLLVVLVLVDDRQPVVAAQLQAALVVGNAEVVVGVEHRGVDAVVVVLYLVVVEALQPVALENLLRHRPVGLAMVEVVGQPVEVVRQLVEVDVQPVHGAQHHDGAVHPVAVDGAGQRLETLGVDAVSRHRHRGAEPQEE